MFFKKKNNLNASSSNTASNNENYQYAFEMLNINKSFTQSMIKANDDLTVRVRKNEIHALIGENGAGKSTIMNILFGIYKPDSGTIFVKDKKVNFKKVTDATKAGLGMVHQHFKLVDVYTLLENIILGNEITKHGFLRNKTSYEKVSAIAKKYGLNINLNTKAQDASVGEQQRAEILKLLYRDVDILIFDEPTAVLSDEEINLFLKLLLEFKKQGKTIVIITHKLNEVKAVADRCTVIRRGKNVGEFDVKDVSVQELTSLMVGNEFTESISQYTPTISQHAEPILSIKNLNSHKANEPKIKMLQDINLDVYPGEIVGVAGIEGNGQSELALILGGLLKPTNGEITHIDIRKNQSENLLKKSIKELYKSGLSHVPEDRLKYGLIPNQTVEMNIVSSQIDEEPFAKKGIINFREINNYAKKIIAKWYVRGANNGKSIAIGLSGGNQQKFVFGREIERKHNLLVLVQPTRGLDLGIIKTMHERIIEDAKKGAAIILISYELDEIFKVASRIIVMDEGKIVFNDLKSKTTQHEIASFLSKSAIVQEGK